MGIDNNENISRQHVLWSAHQTGAHSILQHCSQINIGMNGWPEQLL